MPVKVIEGLPAIDDLRADNIFVMNDERAKNQNIRPLIFAGGQSHAA